MRKIQELSDKIEEELKDACSYIDLAFDLMESDKPTADLYAQLSMEEMGHVDKLHARVVALIEAYRKEKGEPPAEMMWRYNYLHDQHKKKATKIKVKQAVYKEGLK